MKVSYKWLNQYFDKKLPPVEVVVNILTMNSSEVDGVEKVETDLVLDVKILPNMAHSCLCHRGLARELSVLLGLPMNKYSHDFKILKKVETSSLNLKIKIENPEECRRYVGRVMQNIKVCPSPEWLRARLEVLGQRSINNLVDATNFVMLELGQPLHVFDADKIVGDLIEIKKAKANDLITTLDNKQVILDDSVLTISNHGNAIAIAGIKGGTLAEISPKTKNIVLESANFDPVLIRKTAQKLKIQTEASKRYENELTPNLAEEAMEILSKLILEIASTDDTKVGEIVDKYPKPLSQYKLGVSVEEVERVLGMKISEEEIEKIFQRFNFEYKKEKEQLIIEVPFERLDLKIKEDLIEEIGRVYGYDKLPDSQGLNLDREKNSTLGITKVNTSYYYANKIKKILVDQGFSEIYGYTFAEKGDIELANSVAPEKKFLRSDLGTNFKFYLEFNARYSELVAMPQIKIFEIGKVFKKAGEFTHLAIGVKTPVGVKNLPKEIDLINQIVKILETELGGKLDKINSDDNIVEFDFDKIITNLPEPTDYDIEMPAVDSEMRFKRISVYPFMLRDVAVLTPENTEAEAVLKIIKEEGGELLLKYRLFDTFKKGDKISYAYHLVFQSYEKTLSDEEINKIMERITNKMNAQSGWQVR